MLLLLIIQVSPFPLLAAQHSLVADDLVTLTRHVMLFLWKQL